MTARPSFLSVEAGDRTADRRAALALHALGAHDRSWLLARLPEPARERLAPLIAELVDLGLPADFAAVQRLLNSGRPTPTLPLAPAGGIPGSAGSPHDTLLAWLAQDGAAELDKWLAPEPVVLRTQVRALLQRCSEPGTNAYNGRVRGGAPLPGALDAVMPLRLEQALLAALEQRRATVAETDLAIGASVPKRAPSRASRAALQRATHQIAGWTQRRFAS